MAHYRDVIASRGRDWASMIPRSSSYFSCVLSSKSSLAKAARKAADASSKYGVPGPTFGLVAQAAPAGIKDLWPFNWNPTHPSFVRSNPAPESSTRNVYAHPRSTALADGVSTTNSPGGAQIEA